MRRNPWPEIVVFGVVFVAVHLVLWYLTLVVPNQPIGDVTITYRRWIESGQSSHFWVGIDSPWVYPILAIVPMAAAALGGTASIGTGWLLLMVLLNAVAAAVLWRFRAFGVRVVWWWLVFLLALGPIGLGRIDTVATAVALVGVAFVAARPGIAAAVFTVAAWVKVWPAALVGVLFVLRRGRRGEVVAGALTVTALVVLVDVLFGGAAHLLSFIGEQTGRGLQIESPLATPFLWAAAAHVPGAAVFYDHEILTFEVSGAGTTVAAALSTPLMAAVVVVGVVLALLAVRTGARRTQVAPVLALLFVAALIATNKVGSPQYIGWFAVPVVWGLVAGRGAPGGSCPSGPRCCRWRSSRSSCTRATTTRCSPCSRGSSSSCRCGTPSRSRCWCGRSWCSSGCGDRGSHHGPPVRPTTRRTRTPSHDEVVAR